MPSAPSVEHELPLLLFLGFRALVDQLHTRLAEQGHADVRPLHGFVLQAVGPNGTTASGLGDNLGVSKQAAGKIVDRLARLGYLERTEDPTDARRKVVRLTDRGTDLLTRSAVIFGDLRDDWAAAIGERRLRAMEEDLRTLTPGAVRFDVPGWFGS